MTQKIVEVAGNPGALGHPRALSQKLSRRLELGIGRGQALARESLLRQKTGCRARDELEGQIGARQNDSPVPSPVKPHDDEKARALRQAPDDRAAPRQKSAQL